MANIIMPDEIIFYVEDLIFNINKAECLLDAVETPLSLLHCCTLSSIVFPTLFENLPEEHTDGESDPLETDPAGLPVVFRLQ